MINCPQCGNEFDEKTGRRPKKFCSDECKVKWWNERRAVKKEDAADEKLKESLANDKEFTEILEEINKAEPIPNYNTTYEDESQTYLKNQIKEDEAEMATVPDVGFGKQRRKFLQKRISENKKLLI